MFTGIVEELGTVEALERLSDAVRLTVRATSVLDDVRLGDSIAVNGCCLTVAAHRREQITFDLVQETVARTNLGALKRDSPVNLERALAAADRLGGHFVQGHIDCTANIIAFAESDSRLEIGLPQEGACYIAEKGSIAVNGISLTVAEVKPASFVTWIIPHTRRYTSLKTAQAGEQVNLEFDILAKYVERMVAAAAGGISLRSQSGDDGGNSAQ